MIKYDVHAINHSEIVIKATSYTKGRQKEANQENINEKWTLQR